jgi:hypothetical protein
MKCPWHLPLAYNSINSRAIYEVALSATPELSYIAEAIGHASAIQAQTSFQVKELQNENRIKTCKDFEEEEGRINTDMLSRLIIVGGPFIQAGPGMQDQLVKQVFFQFVIRSLYEVLLSLSTCPPSLLARKFQLPYSYSMSVASQKWESEWEVRNSTAAQARGRR